MKPVTIVRLPDGREGTVVYSGLDGYGIRWGRMDVNVEVILSANGLFDEAPADWPYFPEAILRDQYPSAELECVGEEWEIVPTPEAT